MAYRRPTGRPGLITAFLLITLFLTLMGCSGSADVAVEETAPPVLSAEEVQLNLDSFDVVWTTIRDKHWDPDLGGLDWEAVKTELRPQVAEATTMAEARGAMMELIKRLEVSHFGIFPSNLYEDAAAASETEEEYGGDGFTGMDTRVREGQVVVTRIWPDTPAAAAGVQPGWRVLKARETDLVERVAKLTEAMPAKTSSGLTLSLAMQARLTGNVGESLPVVLLDGEDKEHALDLDLVASPGKRFTLGNLPAVRVWQESRTLDNGAGYFAFNYFLGIPEVMPAYNKAMAGFLDAPGMVIDLRGNPGGLGAMAMGMSGWFVAERGHQLGVMIMRTGEIKFAINPRAQIYEGPVAVLIDEISASTAEIMAGGLQDLGRARLFGTTSAGAALPSVIEKLPNGDGFQYAIADYISDGGEQLEGNGVSPDQPVAVNYEDLLKDGDPVLKAAMAWIDAQ